MEAGRRMIEVEPLRPEIYPQVSDWLSDPSINRWLAGRWHGRQFSDKHVAVIAASPATKMYLARLSSEPAGLVVLFNIEREERSAGVWCLVDPSYRSRGVATQALRAVATTAFRDLELASINAWVTAGNDPSRRMLERIGFREVGVMRRASLLDGAHVDRIVFDLLPDDLASTARIRSEED